MKQRVLIPIVGQGSIIHVIRTGMLKRMKDFCEPVVALLWHQQDLIDELTADGFEVHVIPTYKVSSTYTTIRTKINYWYQYFRLKTPSTDIQKKYFMRFKPGKAVIKQRIKENVLHLNFVLNPFYIKRLLKAENSLMQKEDIYTIFKNWVTSLKINGIFTVTPFLHEVELIARIIKKDGGMLLASIHSFDNVTKRGWPAIFFDSYFVWNKYNKVELERINPALKKSDAIYIMGAPQFDFHYNNAYCWTKEEWLKRLGLPSNKKIILYAGGSGRLLPNEPQYVKHIVDAIEKKEIPGDTIILFRCHPLSEIEHWQKFIGDSKHFFYDYKKPVQSRLDYNNFTEDDERRLISTLKHCDVHISVASTMAVDGSIFCKPQISPYYDDIKKTAEAGLRSMYFQEHYMPIVNSGVLNFAESKEQLVSIITGALKSPADYNKSCETCVKEIITFADGRSTDRVIEKMKTFFD